ncbi:MAG: cell division protein ZapB [Bryobacteraceae bacterium]
MQAVQEESVDTLASLEQRITRAVELITSLRSENEQLRQHLNTAQEDLNVVKGARDEAHAQTAWFQKENGDLEQKMIRLSQELDELRGERKQVKARIEKLLGQMDLVSAS